VFGSETAIVLQINSVLAFVCHVPDRTLIIFYEKKKYKIDGTACQVICDLKSFKSDLYLKSFFS
jgi:hypothetical protein